MTHAWSAGKRWASHAILLALALSLVLSACGRPSPTPEPAAEPPATAAVQPSATNTNEPPSPVPPTATDAPVSEEPGAEQTATPLPNPAPATVRLNSPEYGMQAFLWWRPEVATRDVQLVKQAGFGWIKQNVGWSEVELKKGEFDWSRLDDIAKWIGEQQLNLVARISSAPHWATGDCSALDCPPTNYADYGDFVYALASRYKGRFRAYQIWNEPNLAREWGGQPPSPAQYAALLKVAYARIKQADPNAIVISAGLSPTGTYGAEAMPDDVYLEQFYQAMGGSSAGYFDALGVHAPGYKAPPEMSPDEVAADPAYGGKRFFCFRRVEDLRKIMVQYGDSNKQIYILEMGWTSDPVNPAYAWHRVTEEQKADYLVRAYQYAKQNWSPWIGLMSLIYIANPDWTQNQEEYWWAITEPGYPDVKPRPAYTALQAMPK